MDWLFILDLSEDITAIINKLLELHVKTKPYKVL